MIALCPFCGCCSACAAAGGLVGRLVVVWCFYWLVFIVVWVYEFLGYLMCSGLMVCIVLWLVCFEF